MCVLAAPTSTTANVRLIAPGSQPPLCTVRRLAHAVADSPRLSPRPHAAVSVFSQPPTSSEVRLCIGSCGPREYACRSIYRSFDCALTRNLRGYPPLSLALALCKYTLACKYSSPGAKYTPDPSLGVGTAQRAPHPPCILELCSTIGEPSVSTGRTPSPFLVQRTATIRHIGNIDTAAS